MRFAAAACALAIVVCVAVFGAVLAQRATTPVVASAPVAVATPAAKPAPAPTAAKPSPPQARGRGVPPPGGTRRTAGGPGPCRDPAPRHGAGRRTRGCGG